MNHYTPLKIAVRVVVYSLFILGLAEIIMLDAMFPLVDGYFGEISRTEFSQEFILLLLVIFYMLLGNWHRPIKPVSTIIALFLLISLIRELNFLIPTWWIYPVLLVLAVIFWLVWRDFSKLRKATMEFFAQPASGWFFSGILVTFVFSRLMGRSKFWLLMYDESNYRMAKAAVEESIELMGYGLMLLSAVEFALVYFFGKKRDE